MNYLAAFEISAGGMAFERMRADVASLNLANTHTTRGLDGGPYRPLRATAVAQTVSFEQYMTGAAREFSPMTMTVGELRTPPRMVFEPGHPDADSKGYVAYPNVNVVGEMVGMMSATRAFGANVAAMNAAKAMALKTLEIGGNR